MTKQEFSKEFGISILDLNNLIELFERKCKIELAKSYALLHVNKMKDLREIFLELYESSKALRYNRLAELALSIVMQINDRNYQFIEHLLDSVNEEFKRISFLNSYT